MQVSTIHDKGCKLLVAKFFCRKLSDFLAQQIKVFILQVEFHRFNRVFNILIFKCEISEITKGKNRIYGYRKIILNGI